MLDNSFSQLLSRLPSVNLEAPKTRAAGVAAAAIIVSSAVSVACGRLIGRNIARAAHNPESSKFHNWSKAFTASAVASIFLAGLSSLAGYIITRKFTDYTPSLNETAPIASALFLIIGTPMVVGMHKEAKAGDRADTQDNGEEQPYSNGVIGQSEASIGDASVVSSQEQGVNPESDAPPSTDSQADVVPQEVPHSQGEVGEPDDQNPEIEVADEQSSASDQESLTPEGSVNPNPELTASASPSTSLEPELEAGDVRRAEEPVEDEVPAQEPVPEANDIGSRSEQNAGQVQLTTANLEEHNIQFGSPVDSPVQAQGCSSSDTSSEADSFYSAEG